jgi:peptide/nickel transport system substrate-binding protein
MAPTGLAPTAGDQLQWPVWGMHYITAETKGQPPDYAPAIDLLRLLRDWQNTTSTAARATIWADMLAIRADQVLTIGTVSGALQPVVWSSAMRNVPQEALYGFEPTSYLGAYLPDTFYYEGGA